MKPIRDRVLLLPLPNEEKTSSGLFIPEVAKPPKYIGRVVATGPNCTEVKAGDKVVYQISHAAPIDEYLILREEGIIVVLEG